MSWFPVKAKDYNKEAQKYENRAIKKLDKSISNAVSKSHSKPKAITKKQILDREKELRDKILDVFGLINLHIPPLNNDLSNKKTQKKAYNLVKDAGLFANDFEIMPFLQTFIFPNKGGVKSK